MIYLAESGSTKCDAVFLTAQGEEIERIRTMGFNPYFHDRAFVAQEIVKVPEIKARGEQVKQVFFFGAGCSTPALQAEIAEGLKSGFPHAEIFVDHDLKAAAYATYRGEAAITCILGTGSNVVHFDGKEIRPGHSGYGFILGDDGSASNIGRELIRMYLFRLMPPGDREAFFERYRLSEDDIRERVYNQPGANVFLGNLAPFAQERLGVPFYYHLVFEGFRRFIETQVIPFPEAREVPIHFVGSIAYHFETVLRDVIDHFDLKMGVIVRRPVEGLIDYYRKHILIS